MTAHRTMPAVMFAMALITHGGFTQTVEPRHAPVYDPIQLQLRRQQVELGKLQIAEAKARVANQSVSSDRMAAIEQRLDQLEKTIALILAELSKAPK